MMPDTFVMAVIFCHRSSSSVRLKSVGGGGKVVLSGGGVNPVELVKPGLTGGNVFAVGGGSVFCALEDVVADPEGEAEAE